MLTILAKIEFFNCWTKFPNDGHGKDAVYARCLCQVFQLGLPSKVTNDTNRSRTSPSITAIIATQLQSIGRLRNGQFNIFRTQACPEWCTATPV